MLTVIQDFGHFTWTQCGKTPQPAFQNSTASIQDQKLSSSLYANMADSWKLYNASAPTPPLYWTFPPTPPFSSSASTPMPMPKAERSMIILSPLAAPQICSWTPSSSFSMLSFQTSLLPGRCLIQCLKEVLSLGQRWFQGTRKISAHWNPWELLFWCRERDWEPISSLMGVFWRHAQIWAVLGVVSKFMDVLQRAGLWRI